MSDGPIIEIRDLRKVYRVGKVDVEALRGVDLDVRRGEFLSIVGPSGSGKSTLFHIVGGLTPATSGVVRIDGQDVGAMSDADRTRLRKSSVSAPWRNCTRRSPAGIKVTVISSAPSLRTLIGDASSRSSAVGLWLPVPHWDIFCRVASLLRRNSRAAGRRPGWADLTARSRFVTCGLRERCGSRQQQHRDTEHLSHFLAPSS